MVTKCVVQNCGNSCNTKLSVTLFSFPKDPQLAQTWLKLTRAHGIKNIKSHHKVCSKHFERRVIQDHFGATRLEPGAIPTIFDWNDEQRLHTRFVTNRNPYLYFNDVGLQPPNKHLVLPKTPKVGIPPIVKQLTDTKTSILGVFKKKALLSCDVILPDRRVASNKKLYIKTRETKCNGEEVAEDIRRLCENVFPVKTECRLQMSDDDSNGSHHVGHHIEDYEENSLIEEISNPLHTDMAAQLISRNEDFLDKTGAHLTLASAGDIIIEECCVIQDEIIPPERANDTLSPLFFLNTAEEREEPARRELPELISDLPDNPPPVTPPSPIISSSPPYVENDTSSSQTDKVILRRTLKNREKRQSKKFSAADFELRRKSLCIKELRREKMRLSVKLKFLQNAFVKLRRASILTLSSARLLEGANPVVDTPNLNGRCPVRKLNSFVDSVHLASQRLYNHFKNDQTVGKMIEERHVDQGKPNGD